MKANEYIKDRLENCSAYELSDQDKKVIKTKGIERYIFQKLTSKKFRKWSLDEESAQSIQNAIKINVKGNSPIIFTFPFGGYKLSQLPSSPEIDWAEFFTVAYYSQWISSIAEAYKPGVRFIFSSDDVIIERMDNISKKDTQAYFESFKKLLASFNKYSPSNMEFEIKRVGDLYSEKELEDELGPYVEQVKIEYKNPEPVRYKKMIKTSRLNIQWRGVEDWSKLTEKEKEEKVKMGPIYHDAYGKLVRRKEFVRGEDRIVVFTTPISKAIALGTTKNSITKFWTGYGILEEENGKFYDRILSPEQYGKVKSKLKPEKVDVIDLENLKNIDVSDTRLTFTK